MRATLKREAPFSAPLEPQTNLIDRILVAYKTSVALMKNPCPARRLVDRPTRIAPSQAAVDFVYSISSSGIQWSGVVEIASTMAE